MRNELAGTEATLFTGRAKVEKVLTGGAPKPRDFVYYANQDWNMPIGMVSVTARDRQIDYPGKLEVRFWVRGDYSNMEPHVFYQGKEVGIVYVAGMRAAAPSCGNEISYETSQSVA